MTIHRLALAERGWTFGQLGSNGFSSFSGFYETNEVAICPGCGEAHHLNERGRLQVNGREVDECFNCRHKA